MDQQRLWAPWRIGYVQGGVSGGPVPTPRSWRPDAATDCFLCRAAAEFDEPHEAARRLLVAAVTDEAVAVLNRYPYNNGHLLVSPRRHAADLADLTPGEHLAVQHLLGQFIARYRNVLQAEGFNIGLNLGRVAGAGVPGHLHWHLVPRWPGDANFMPTTAATQVIPQSLEALWEAVRSEA